MSPSSKIRRCYITIHHKFSFHGDGNPNQPKWF